MMPNGDWKFYLDSNRDCRTSLNQEDQENMLFDIKSFSDLFKKTEPVNEVSRDDILKCVDQFKSKLSGRASELCGDKQYELYGCINSEDKTIQSEIQYNSHGYYMTCYLRCK